MIPSILQETECQRPLTVGPSLETHLGLFARMLKIYLDWAATVPEIAQAVDQELRDK